VLTFTLKTPIHIMIELFRTSRSHLAIVLDREEHTVGLVTFEDVLEKSSATSATSSTSAAARCLNAPSRASW